MAQKLDDQAQTRMALAALTAALVRTLEQSGVIVGQDFVTNLEKIYNEARHWESEPIGLLETLSWTREILKDQLQK